MGATTPLEGNIYTTAETGIDTSGIGVSNAQSLTLFENYPDQPSFSVEADAGSDAATPTGEPHLVLVFLLLGLVALGFVRKSSSHLEQNTIAFNAFNFTVMIFSVMLGIAIFKVIFTKYKVPGVTALVHAI